MPIPVLTVHRSAQEIGGNCIEIEYGNHRLLLDAGSPLDADFTDNPASLVPLTLDTSRPVDALLISHPHQDHYGLLPSLPKEWPVWCGGPTETLMRLTSSITGKTIPQSVNSYRSFVPFTIGPFQITPFLTDHSAFDAHMLLVEVGGKRILYSGDFRRTGRKAKLVDRMMADPPSEVDVLLLEGTTLGRSGHFPSESDLEAEFIDLFRSTPGRVFVTWSAQNIDRTVTLYLASRRAGRTLLLDIYALDVLDRLSGFRKTLPRLDLPGIRGVVTGGIKGLYEDPRRMNNPAFFERCCLSGHAFSASNLESGQHYNVIMLRPTLLRDYLRKGLVITGNDAWVFSMWSGYLKKPEFEAVRQRFDGAGATFAEIHTSGHASPDEIEAFAAAVAPRHLVPIHSFDWDDHASRFANVKRLRDGEAFELRNLSQKNPSSDERNTR